MSRKIPVAATSRAKPAVHPKHEHLRKRTSVAKSPVPGVAVNPHHTNGGLFPNGKVPGYSVATKI